mgnify:CR=1 FL=1
MTVVGAKPVWQCVLICWGTKYSTQLINNLVEHIRAKTHHVPRFVLITDEEKPDLLDEVEIVRFPTHWLETSLRRSGCQAKLVMFEKGVLREDLPALYIDLDTVVFGDMYRFLSLLETPQTVAMLQSALIPFGPIGRLRYRLSSGNHYARGNSSFVVFHPAHNHYIATKFLELLAKNPNFEFRPMIADERFISWVAQPHMKVVPKAFAVKFPGEFMFYWGWWLYVRALFPWVRARRRKLLAVTLNGLEIKPDKLCELREGERTADEEGRVLIWSFWTMGAKLEEIRAFYKGFV